MPDEITGEEEPTEIDAASVDDPPVVDKTFTQTDVDRIVSKRVNKMKSEITDLGSKAELLDNMMKDEKFRSWLEGEAGGGDTKTDPTDPDIMTEITNLDPALGPKVIKFVKDLVTKELGLVKGEVDTMKATNAKDASDKAVVDMFQAVDEHGQPKFPWTKDQEFNNEMADLLQGNRVHTLEDAYDLASLGRQRNGEEPPGTNTKSADAELLESDETGITTTQTKQNPNSPKVFKSFEDCFNAVAETRKWYKK